MLKLLHSATFRKRFGHRRRTVGGPCRLRVEHLETRALLSATFSAGPLSTPVITGEIIPGGLNTGTPIEPAVSINPTDPANVVISSQNGLEVSTNGGATFTSTTTFSKVGGLPGGGEGGFGDTSTAFDNQGRLFWTNLDPATSGLAIKQLNPTTGALIAGPFAVHTPGAGFGDDKEVLTADGNGNLYVVWTTFGPNGTQVLLSRSTDQGQTWSAATAVSPDPATDTTEGFVWPATVTAAPNGDIYVAYHSQTGFNGPNPDGISGQVFVARYSNNLGSQLSKNLAFEPGDSDVTFNVQSTVDNKGNPVLASRRIPFTTFWTQGSVQPYVLADPVRPGNVYVITADDPNNGGSLIDFANAVIARSTDNGKDWSASTIDAGVSLGTNVAQSFQLFPTAAIDQAGNIIVAWYDNRGNHENEENHNYVLDVYARYSTDGGVTWSNAFKINATTFDPDPGATVRFNGPPQATTRIGEYFGLAMSNGTAHVAWNDNTFDSMGNATGQQVYTATVSIKGSLTVTAPNFAGNVVTIDALAGSLPSNPFVEVLTNSKLEYAGIASGLTGITVDVSTNTNPGTINVERTFSGTNVVVDTSSHTDTINISPVAQDLDNIQGDVGVNGMGTDVLNIFDQKNASPGDSWALNGFSIGRTHSAPISFGGLSAINVSGSNLGATFDIQSISPGSNPAALTVAGGGGPDTFVVQGPSTFMPVTLNGGGGLDTLVGPDAAMTWNVTGANAGHLGAAIAFTNVESLAGGSKDDNFVFGPAGMISGNVDGGGGSNNALDYSADGGVSVNLQTRAASRINAGAAGGFRRILHLAGSAGGGDLLVGPDAKSTWFITGVNSGSIGGFTFTGVENLQGGSQNDIFRFNAGGRLQGAVDGGGGSNGLDYSADGGSGATVNLQTHVASLLRAGTSGGFVHIQAVVGSTAATDRLIGLNGITLWQVTGNNAGLVGTVAFSGFESLQGGTASDTFRFAPSGTISGAIAGGGGGDWLDYSLFTTPVHVNLATGFATHVSSGAPGKISQIQNVKGGSGGNTLLGNSLGNVLVGGVGNDTIVGGTGRSVLIGGAGADTIKGGSADDILIGGTTNFDSNHTALIAILSEWQRTDQTYAQRIADLKNGGGSNGTNKLILGATVHDDSAADTLTGGAGLDWFFANLGPGGVLDHITDRNNGGTEQVN
jgi:hypothetical protein